MKLKPFTHYIGAVHRRTSLASVVPAFASHQKHHSSSVVVMGTPTHSNLGDQAIVYAQEQLLSDAGLNDIAFEIPRTTYERFHGHIDHLIRPHDLVIIDGGGNLGTLWPEENTFINTILNKFKNNHIVMFPQTAYYEDTPLGRITQEETAQVFSENPNIVFYSRDQPTYKLIKVLSLQTTNYLVPDIVPYLELDDLHHERSGALLCLRSDKERVLEPKDAETLECFLRDKLSSVHNTSTLSATQFIGRARRSEELQAKWNEFASAKLVVTDRLHGMIFSAITGTPCVALDNVSHKVQEGASWLSDIPNIKVTTSAFEAKQAIQDVLEVGPLTYRRGKRAPYYESIKQVILDAIK